MNAIAKFTVTVTLGFLSLTSLTAQEENTPGTWSLSPIEVKTLPGQKALVKKAEVAMSSISETMGAIYQSVFSYVQAQNIQPAGPPIAVYYSFDPAGNVVFEAGLPVTQTVEPDGDMVFKEYPEMRVVSALYTGAYANMEPAYKQIQAYIGEHALESTGISWEVYLTDPAQVAPDQNQTLIYFPVR